MCNLPLVRGRRERSERGGRSHTISNLRLGNTPEGRGNELYADEPRSGERIFRRSAAHRGRNRLHGLQPWLYSVAAPRLNKRELRGGFRC
jgi:hypothetical protein